MVYLNKQTKKKGIENVRGNVNSGSDDASKKLNQDKDGGSR